MREGKRKGRFEDYFKKINEEINNSNYSSYKAFKKIYAKMRKTGSSIKEYIYREKSSGETGSLKLMIKQYKANGLPKEEWYELKSTRNPEIIKELAVMIDLFLEDKPAKRYYEGYAGRIKIGTKDHVKKFDEYKKQIARKYAIISEKYEKKNLRNNYLFFYRRIKSA